MKTCSQCKTQKGEMDFHKDVRSKDGRQSVCKLCRKSNKKEFYITNKESFRKYREDNSDKIKAYRDSNRIRERARNKIYVLKKRYGLTLDQVEQMYVSQNERCMICKNEFQDRIHMHIDHNHTTGQLRDLLCSKCNSGIGLLDENIERLESAIQYLKKWGGVCV